MSGTAAAPARSTARRRDVGHHGIELWRVRGSCRPQLARIDAREGYRGRQGWSKRWVRRGVRGAAKPASTNVGSFVRKIRDRRGIAPPAMLSVTSSAIRTLGWNE